MAAYTFNEYADMHLMYGKASGNCYEARRLYSENYPNRVLPDRRTFERVDRSIREHGSVQPKLGGVGPVRNVRTAALEDNILDEVDNNPTTSIRKIALQQNVSKTSVHRILREQLLHPYHLQKVQGLDPQDFPARLEYARWFLRKQAQNRNFIASVLFSDEAGFTRDGVINSHNLHLWDEENPHGIIQARHQQRFIVNVWAGILGNHLVGPFIINGNLNGQSYLQFLQNDLPLLLEDISLQTRQNMWYMHDGAPAHFTLIVRDHLNQMYPNKWIGRGGPVEWPPRTPELNQMDSFFWGYLKSLVYATPVQTRNELLNRIQFHCDAIRNNPGLLFQVQRNHLLRLRKCVEVRGGHFEHLL